jgi:murein DD-endopeptidase MepM/ murein hydrolase activator NlpD
MSALSWHTIALGGLLALASCSVSEASSNDNASADMTVAAERTGFEAIEGEFTQGGWVRGKAPSGVTTVSMGEKVIAVGEDGSFFAAFDRDEGDLATLTATLGNGETRDKMLAISPRQWKISRVSVSRGRGNNLEAWWKKREPEYNAIRDARARETGATGWKQDFIWPTRGRISGFFGRQRIYAGEPGPYHSGIDVAAGTGTPIVAPADGVIVLARTGFSLEGGIVIVDHGAGLNSAFIHLSKVPVIEGQRVKQGQLIGNVGSTGRSTGPHMHWSLMWGESRIDPLLMAGPMR